MIKTGLVLGKFAPFHRGHGYLIEVALAESEHLIVLVYQAKRTTAIPLHTRAGWIRTLYPQVEVIEAADGPEDTGYSMEIQLLHERFLTRLLEDRRIDAFFSSEIYGAHVSRALGCLDRRVDSDRVQVPVSGTMLREDAALWHQYLAPLVRADLVRRIVLLGGPSTGKTSLAAALARRLEEPWCHEYGRDYWFAHQVNHRLSMEDLETIAREQVALESRLALQANVFLPVDTCPMTTWVYALRYFGCSSEVLDKILSDYLAFPREYWLCGTDIPFEDSPDRSGPGSREEHQERTVTELRRRGLSWQPVSGTIAERVETIMTSLKGKL
jgi:NadR type nicotinamide-nucleotide adenylyltransferase